MSTFEGDIGLDFDEETAIVAEFFLGQSIAPIIDIEDVALALAQEVNDVTYPIELELEF